MSTGLNRTVELLEHAIASKRNLVDTLVEKGEEAAFDEPFDDLVQKAGDYVPKTYILEDPGGGEVVGVLVEQETIFDATENDVREGKIFASELGVKTGTKVIPSYNTTEGIALAPAGSICSITLRHHDLYKFTKLQALICEFNSSINNSVATVMVSVDGNVYETRSTEVVALVTTNDATKTINLGVKNKTDKPLIIRYFTYKEIE